MAGQIFQDFDGVLVPPCEMGQARSQDFRQRGGLGVGQAGQQGRRLVIIPFPEADAHLQQVGACRGIRRVLMNLHKLAGHIIFILEQKENSHFQGLIHGGLLFLFPAQNPKADVLAPGVNQEKNAHDEQAGQEKDKHGQPCGNRPSLDKIIIFNQKIIIQSDPIHADQKQSEQREQEQEMLQFHLI